MPEYFETMPEYFKELVPSFLGYAVSAVGALVLLLVAWIAAGIASRLVRRSLNKAAFDATLTRFFTKFARWLVLLTAVIGCLGIFGVETTSFAAVIGAAGLAMGLAFQGTLSNFAAGVMLLAFRPFKVGDVVCVAGQTGKVDEIGVFTTIVDTFDNRRFIIPNSSVFGSTIENITHHPVRRADVDVGVSYDADLDKTRAVLEKAAGGVQDVLEDPAPAILLMGLGDSSIDWSVRVWAKSEDFGAVKQRTIQAVKAALDEAGIEIPFPHMEVRLSGQEPRTLEPQPSTLNPQP
jgi:small conductance mechanosensitive channel